MVHLEQFRVEVIILFYVILDNFSQHSKIICSVLKPWHGTHLLNYDKLEAISGCVEFKSIGGFHLFSFARVFNVCDAL